ncbi:hypothetical protein ES705_23409 [subsurface metagenome]
MERLSETGRQDKEAFVQRTELILAMIHRGEELVADGKSFDEAAETAYNECGRPVSKKRA